MRRRDLLKGSLASGAMLAASRSARGARKSASASTGADGTLRAGFALEKITPPLGTRMMGFGRRDYEQGCQSIQRQCVQAAVQWKMRIALSAAEN